MSACREGLSTRVTSTKRNRPVKLIHRAASFWAQVTDKVTGEDSLRETYLMNSISWYVGSGQRSSATIPSSSSTAFRTTSICGRTLWQ